MADENKEEIITPTPELSRREAIEKGMDDLEKNDKDDEKKGSSKKEDTPDEEDPDKEDAEDTEEGDEPSKDEIRDALNLSKALNGPRGKDLLKILAREAGLLDSSTKEEKKEIKRTVKEVIKEKLGSDYQFLADKLGDALEEVIKSNKDADVEEIKSRLDAREKADLSKEIDSALTNAIGRYEDVPKKVMTRFNELIDEMPPTPGKTDPAKYFKRLITLAADETDTELVLKSSDSKDSKDSKENKNTKSNELSQIMKDRLKRNRSDASSRLASKGAAAEVDETSKNAPPPKSRREAIENAAKEVAEKMKV